MCGSELDSALFCTVLTVGHQMPTTESEAGCGPVLFTNQLSFRDDLQWTLPNSTTVVGINKPGRCPWLFKHKLPIYTAKFVNLTWRRVHLCLISVRYACALASESCFPHRQDVRHSLARHSRRHMTAGARRCHLSIFRVTPYPR